MGEIVPRRENENALAADYVSTGTADTTALAVATTRAAEEVKARMVMAHHCPRDEPRAYARIMKSCQRKSLAEQAQYCYPRGGQKIIGPSIRLAEVLARAWGNMDAGFTELEQRDGESIVEAFAWDLETNTRIVRTFTVPHIRDTKKGSYKLTDARDIYEMVANQAQRRVRACILGIVPGDIVEAAVEQCNKTLASGSDVPLGDRVRKMVAAFSTFNVSAEMVEARLGHKLEVTSEAELVMLRQIYTSLKDGMSGAAQWFSPPEDPGAAALRKQLEDQAARKTAPPAKTQTPPAPAPAPAPAPVTEEPDEVPENVDPITGEILDEKTEPPQTNLADMMRGANGVQPDEAPPAESQEEPGMTRKEKERAKLIDVYLELCSQNGMKAKQVTNMSLQALKGHIATITEQN